MKICVYGAGAIGGHLAARLSAGGAVVSVVARGAQLTAIQANGLVVEAPDGRLKARIQATDDPATLGHQDAVLVTVKSPSLPSVASGIGPLLGPKTQVVFVMNGIPWWYFHSHGGPLEGKRLPLIDPGGAVWAAVGPERTIGGVVYSACTVVSPGVVRVDTKHDRLIIGTPGGGASSTGQAIASTLGSGGFHCEVSAGIRDAIWTKLAMNIAMGPTCTLARSAPSAVLSDRTLEAAVRSLVVEAVAMAHGMGCSIEVDADAIVASAKHSQHKPSILQDLELGRPMEIDALYTVPLSLAEAAGVQAPTLALLTALMRVQARSVDL